MSYSLSDVPNGRNGMAVEITTISVSPKNVDGLRELRDHLDLRSMGAALGELLESAQRETKDTKSTN